MPGFTSSFPEPAPRDIERYKKLLRFLDAASNASPSEMHQARQQIEKLEAEFPSIRLHAREEEKVVPPSGPSFNPETVQNFLNTFKDIMEAAKSATAGRTLAAHGCGVDSRLLRDGSVAVTLTIDTRAFDRVLRLKPFDRDQFIAAATEQVTLEIQEVIEAARE